MLRSRGKAGRAISSCEGFHEHTLTGQTVDLPERSFCSHVAVATDPSGHEAMGDREERIMRKTFLVSTSAIALLAATPLALAQGAAREAPSPAPGAQQSAPAEKMAPAPGGAQQKAPDAGTTGQGSPQRMEQDRPSGAQSQDRMKSGDPKPAEPRASGTKSDDKAKPDAAGTTGQGAAGAAKLTTEQRTKISTSIKQTNVRPVTNVSFNVSVGGVVPRTVELHPLPASIIEVYPAWRGYRFILVKEEIIIIEPDTYRIVAVIDV
jgi:hypothetical protein